MKEESRPLVSAIIPAYNCAEFLPAAIESALAQTYSPLEVIVVDDGSTDNIDDAIAPYLGRIHYVVQVNKGLAAARNIGIHASRGEFIALLDADDYWLPQKLDEQMPCFSDPEAGIVYSDFAVRYADGRSLPSYLAHRPLASEGYVLEPYIRSRFLFPSSMVLRRRCIQEAGYFDEDMFACEDIELFARILLRWKVCYIRQSLMVRYEGTHNITANNDKLNRYTVLALLKVLEKEPQLPAPARKTIRRELAQQYSWLGYAQFKKLEIPAARRSLMQAVRFDLRQVRSSLPLLLACLLPASILERRQRQKVTRVEEVS